MKKKEHQSCKKPNFFRLLGFLFLCGMVMSTPVFAVGKHITQALEQHDYTEALTLLHQDISFFKQNLTFFVNEPSQSQITRIRLSQAYERAAFCYLQLEEHINAELYLRRAYHYLPDNPDPALLQTLQQTQRLIQTQSSQQTNQNEEQLLFPLDPLPPLPEPENPEGSTPLIIHPVNSSQDQDDGEFTGNAPEVNPQNTSYEALLDKESYTQSDFQACLEAATYFLNQQQTNQALVFLLQAKDIACTLDDRTLEKQSYERLAVYYTHENQTGEALAYYNRLMRLLLEDEEQDRIVATLYEVSKVLINRGERDRARRILQRLLEMPETMPVMKPTIQFSLGMIHFSDKRFQRAQYYFESLYQSFNPEHPSTLIAQTLYWLGLCYIRLDQIQQAIERLKTSKELFLRLGTNDSELVEQTLQRLQSQVDAQNEHEINQTAHQSDTVME